MAPVRERCVGAAKPAGLTQGDQRRDRAVAVGEDEVAGLVFGRFLTGAVPLGLSHMSNRRALIMQGCSELGGWSTRRTRDPGSRACVAAADSNIGDRAARRFAT